jgi:hypothetical protein
MPGHESSVLSNEDHDRACRMARRPSIRSALFTARRVRIPRCAGLPLAHLTMGFGWYRINLCAGYKPCHRRLAVFTRLARRIGTGIGGA